MKWYELEKRGWSWAIGWSRTRNSYYAQAWRDLPKLKRVNGSLMFRECITETGRNLYEASCKLWQRLDGLEGESISDQNS